MSHATVNRTETMDSRSQGSTKSVLYPSLLKAPGRRNAIASRVPGESSSLGVLIDVTTGLRISYSDENHYLNVVWYANMVTDPRGNSRLQHYTTTTNHCPPLAQEIEDRPNNPASFRHPLAQMNLDMVCHVDDYGGFDFNGEVTRKDASAMESVVSTRPQRRGRSPRTSRACLLALRGMGSRRYLRTAPNRYLPVPPLERTPYYYSYGRCPACSNNKPLQNQPGPNATLNSSVGGALERRSPRAVRNYTKNGPLEHLAGKLKYRSTGGQRAESLRHLKKYMAELLRSPNPVLTRPPSSQTSEETTGEDSVEIQAGIFEQRENNLVNYETVGFGDFQGDTVGAKEDTESLPSFASARELQNGREFSIESDDFAKRCQHMNQQRFTPRYQLKPYVSDLMDMLPGTVILASKLKDFDCKIPLIELSTELMRELYKVTILNDNLLNRIYHRRNFRNLPSDLQYLRNVNFLQLYESRSIKIRDSETDRDQQHFVMTHNYSKCILAEMSNQFYETDVVHLGLFTNWLEKAVADKALLELKTPREIGRLFQLLGDELYVSNFGLGGTTRLELLIIMATAAHEPKMRRHLWAQARHWLEPLIGGIFATSSNVRDESCYTLAYMFSINSLVEDIRRSLSYDIPYDATRSVLKAIDLHPESIMTYQVLLGYIVEGCPSISILNCIMEFGPLCQNNEFKQRWPLFIYYAVKHWKEMYLTVDAVYPTVLMMNMAKAAMDPVTRKAAKLALLALARKFERPMGAVTHWNTNWLRLNE